MNVARVVRVVGVVGLLAGAVLAVPAVAVADSGPIWGDATPATFAADIQNAAPTAQLNSVSCVSAGHCTAAGSFKDLAGNTQAFTQTSTSGTWGNAVPATFVTNVQNVAPDANLSSVSCVSAGHCTAAGSFKDLAGNTQAFTQTSTSGTWGNAVPATFATNVQYAAPYARFDTVSCASTGNCTAAGRFKDLAGNLQAFTQTSTGGTWAQAVPATLAAGLQSAAPFAYFSSVSCASAGNCTAAGRFKDLAGNFQAFTQTSTGGTWGNAVPATYAAGIQNAAPYAYFNSVSCASAGNCTAAGAFKDQGGNTQAFTQSSTGGTWGNAVPTTFAADIQNAAPNAYFNSVSCTPAGYCTAAGQFKDLGGNTQAFAQTSTGGTWGNAVPTTFATGIQNATPYAYFNSVSCAPAGYCTAAGTFKDLAGNYLAFTQTSTGGTWGNAVPATFTTDIQNAAPNAYFKSVSCTPAGYCTAAGRFKDQAGNLQAFTQTSTGSEPPVLPPTGADTDGFVAGAVVFLAAGGLLVVTRRRRVLSA
ncbi:MAG: hypothetical protein F2934_03425 [Actinobacteria bacterium]|uniref:Unannotated protein n=1 Tax=freshwater metagenome TaxID=449393 RepID=A0A6J7TXK0_9ZZZZ|nr:hypothetical protein [Actinomycetota bacterium]